MTNNKRVLPASLAIAFLVAASAGEVQADDKINNKKDEAKNTLTRKPDSYWKSKLDPQVYKITRCSATEPAFTGKYWNNHEPGVYRCSNCGEVLFESKDKFDSGTGWPSFTKAQGNSVETRLDQSLGMTRDEVICKHCGAHLGHLFDDGPAPTGKRYCINSASLGFQQEKLKSTGKPSKAANEM